IEIKRGYEVLPDNSVKFGIRIINNSDFAISDVEVLLDYTESLFNLEGNKIQKFGNIPPTIARTAKFILKPLGCVHKENVGATILYKDHKWEKHVESIRSKEVHCVCPFLKEMSITRSKFLELSTAGHSIEAGINFEGVTVNQLTTFLMQTCTNRLYKVEGYSIEGGKILYLAGESIGEKAYYLLTVIIKENEGLTQVMLRAVSDKSYGLNGFMNEITADLRHVVNTVQSAHEIGIIKKEQVINIIDSVVQRTIFNGSGEGAARVNIVNSVSQRNEFGVNEDSIVKKQNEKEIANMEYSGVYEYLIEIARNGCNEQNTELDLSDEAEREELREKRILVTYGDLLEKFGEKPSDPKAQKELFKILDQINEKTTKYDVPILLSALVVGKKNQFIPGKQFFPKWLPDVKDEDKLSTWTKEVEKIWQHYCKMEYSGVYEYLINVARNRCNEKNTELDLSVIGERKILRNRKAKILVAYGDVLENFGEISNDSKARTKLFKILDQINEKTTKYDVPILLSALVINQNDFNPSDKFFSKWLSKTEEDDKLSTWIKELEKIWQHYCKRY
ncbi:MAG: hypothetical protein Q7J10_07615, partial [Methanosarcinaceae archaeon]|nr:hypothetical protein [Methanosarcinaceae archaeon]